MKSLYIYIYTYGTCTKAVCPLIIFTKPLKKQNESGIQVSLFFNQKKSTWEKFSKTTENELIVDGNQPTFFGTGKNSRESCVVRPVAHQIHSWIEVHHLGSNHPIRYSSVWFYKKKIHTPPNEWIYGWTFHGSMFLPPKKEKTVKILFVFVGKDMWYFLHRSTFFLTIILPTLPKNKRLKQVSCKDKFLPPTVLP